MNRSKHLTKMVNKMIFFPVFWEKIFFHYRRLPSLKNEMLLQTYFYLNVPLCDPQIEGVPKNVIQQGLNRKPETS